MRLAVLDQSPIVSGESPEQALDDSIRLAQATEAMGYARYWVAEHHGSASFAGSAPEIMITRIGAATRTIRIGSAGVMLMHYSPLKVAENFRVLSCLFPGRVDLGIGRAPGSDGLTASALAYGSRIGPEYFPARMADLFGFVRGLRPNTDALAGVRATPEAAVAPELWMLGSTIDGAQLAAHFGLAFSFAHFISPDIAAAACASYRTAFRATDIGDTPRVNLAVFALCADTGEQAAMMARCRDVWRCRVEQGRFEPFPTIAEAADYRFTPDERTRIEQRGGHTLAGTATEVAERLSALVGRTGADEVTVLSITPEFEQRLRCYDLLIRALG